MATDKTPAKRQTGAPEFNLKLSPLGKPMKKAAGNVPVKAPPQPTIELVPLALIQRPNTQRPVNAEWAKHIKDTYEDRMLDLLLVSRRTWNGNQLHGIDLGHRLVALRDMGYTHAWCLIIETKSEDDEARLMIGKSIQRRRYAPAAAHRALYLVEDDKALRVESLIQPLGCTFLPDHDQYASVGGVSMFYDPTLSGKKGLLDFNFYAFDPDAHTKGVFTVLAKGWGKPSAQTRWMRKDIVPGLWELRRRAAHITDKEIGVALAEWPMDVMIGNAVAMHGASARNQSRSRWATVWAEHIYPDPDDAVWTSLRPILPTAPSLAFEGGMLRDLLGATV